MFVKFRVIPTNFMFKSYSAVEKCLFDGEQKFTQLK